MFFLVAHAFYKALMFLGAGSVIHGMHDETGPAADGWPAPAHADHVRDVPRRARSRWPGIPPLAGFFAKDAVLEVAQHTGREVVYVLGSIAAFLSAFYIGRLIFLTFFGDGPERRARARARVAAG